MAIITNLYTLFIKIGSLGATVKHTNIPGLPKIVPFLLASLYSSKNILCTRRKD